MRLLPLILLLLRAFPVAAASADPRLLFDPPIDTTVTHGPKTTFSVDIDLSKAKALKGSEPIILLTVITPDGGTFQLDSRPLHAGEKLRWQTKIPANGGYVLRVIRAGSGSSKGGQMLGPIAMKLTVDAWGNMSMK